MRKNKLPYKLFTSPPSGPDFPACPHNREESIKYCLRALPAGWQNETFYVQISINQLPSDASFSSLAASG